MDIIPVLAPAIMLTLPFLVAYAALHVLLFRPFHDFIEERDGVASKARGEASEMIEATHDKLNRLQAKLVSARKVAGEIRQAARGRAHEEEAKILASAREASDGHVAEAVLRIAEEKKKASATLRGTARVLSGDIAKQILGAN